MLVTLLEGINHEQEPDSDAHELPHKKKHSHKSEVLVGSTAVSDSLCDEDPDHYDMDPKHGTREDEQRQEAPPEAGGLILDCCFIQCVESLFEFIV